jgi:hypothetical protein
MYQIGFSNKHFTLWNVSEPFQRFTGTGSWYWEQSFQFVQNLGFNRTDAFNRARQLTGQKQINIDYSLKGKSMSFTKKMESVCRMPNNLSPFFEFGKYRDDKIDNTIDPKYLFWYYEQTGNVHAKKILIDSGEYVEHGDKLVAHDEIQHKMHVDKIVDVADESDELEVTAIRNINMNGVLKVDLDGVVLDFEIGDKVGTKYFTYNEYEYHLPVIDGKAKRIKNKKIKIKYHTINHTRIIDEIELVTAQQKLDLKTQ